MVGGGPPSSQHISPLCPPASFVATLIYTLLLSLSGQVSWPDLSPPMEGSLGSTPKGTQQKGGAGEAGERWRPLELDLEARGRGEVGLCTTKSNDVVGRENQAAARISPEALHLSSVSSSLADSWLQGSLASVSSHIDEPLSALVG